MQRYFLCVICSVVALADGTRAASDGLANQTRAGVPSTSIKVPNDGSVIHWDALHDPDPQRYETTGLTLTLSKQSDRGEDQAAAAMLRIEETPSRSLEVTGAPGYSFAPVEFAVARFDSESKALGVLFMTHTGGAHCCAETVVAEKVGGRWAKVWVGSFDAWEPSRIEDVDGDHVADIIAVDDRFDYTFASFGGSYRPPAIFNIRNGKAWNVSAEPKYRKAFEAAMVEAQAVCLGGRGGSEINGACAAFVADASRVGRFAWAWQLMLHHYDRSRDYEQYCSAKEIKGICPQGKGRIAEPFPVQLGVFLKKSGYI